MLFCLLAARYGAGHEQKRGSGGLIFVSGAFRADRYPPIVPLFSSSRQYQSARWSSCSHVSRGDFMSPNIFKASPQLVNIYPNRLPPVGISPVNRHSAPWKCRTIGQPQT